MRQARERRRLARDGAVCGEYPKHGTPSRHRVFDRDGRQGRTPTLISKQTAEAKRMTGCHARYLSPPRVAERYGVDPSKVRGWIRRGELRAVNLASHVGGRPRWRIDPADLATFEAMRAAKPPPPRQPRRRRCHSGVIEFF